MATEEKGEKKRRKGAIALKYDEARDQAPSVAAKGWGEVAPFYVELESPQPAGGLPRAGAMTVSLRNEHLQYALTWYALAAVVLVMLAIWLAGRRRA